MMREIETPTGALAMIVDRVLQPRLEYLSSIVTALLDSPADTEDVRQCVLSINAQCLATLKNPVSERLGYPAIALDRVPAVASHIARFSIGGIRAIRAGSPARRGLRRTVRRAPRARPRRQP
jgi:hypothetical protein